MRSEEELNRAIERHADTVKRICMIHLKNASDTEDIFQTVFMRYLLDATVFEGEEHEKAWLIRVAINASRDLRKSFFVRHTVSLEELVEEPEAISPESREVLEEVLSLPSKYRDVVYLHYYEGIRLLRLAASSKRM